MKHWRITVEISFIDVPDGRPAIRLDSSPLRTKSHAVTDEFGDAAASAMCDEP